MQTTLNFDSPIYPEPQSETFSWANEFVLSYKKSDVINSFNEKQFHSSSRIEKFLREIWDTNRMAYQESFYVLFFRPSVQLTGFFKIADGIIDAVPVDLRTLFTSALLSGANKIVLAHNHPSGTLKPSPADINLTNKAVNAGELLDIEIIDHIIITENSYYSFKDEGLL